MPRVTAWFAAAYAGLALHGMAYAQTSERLRTLVERLQAQSQPKLTPMQYLQRVIHHDPAFDPERRAPRSFDPETQAAYDGVLCLLSDSLRAQFCGLSSDALRREWLRRYWILQDPTPTTPENERFLEHRRRVEHASQHFASTESPFWDDRGTFYILYGPPDGVTRIPAEIHDPLGYIPERMVWHYPDEVAAPFELRNPPSGPWKFGISAKSFSWRPHFKHDLRRPSYDQEVPSFADTDPMNAARVALSMAAASTVLETRRERFTMPGTATRFLWFVFDTDVFRVGGHGVSGEPSRTMARLEAHIQFAVKDLTFRWADSLYTARYRVEGVLLDEDLQEAARDAYEMNLDANRFDTTNRANLWPGQLNLAAPPGSYRMALRLVDLASLDEGTYTTEVQIHRHDPAALGLSDIELATSIASSDGYQSSRFAKAGRLVLPNPIGLYGHGSPFMAYLEIYGLKLDENRAGRYRLSYRIEARADAVGSRKRGRQRAYVTSSFVVTTSTRNPVEELRIDIDSLDEASYDLVIEVEDLVGSGKIAARTPFTVLRL